MTSKQIRTLKKEWYWKAKMERLGVLQAEREFNSKKQRKKPIENRLIDWLENKLSQTDPIELAAIAGLTLILQPGIATSEKFLAFLTKHQKETAEQQRLDWIDPIAGLAKSIASEAGVSLTGSATLDVILSWIVAFVLAAILVKYAPKMLTGAESITQMFAIDGLLGVLLL